MGYTVRITKRQLRYFSKLAKTEGKVLIKHLPDSSDFSSKEGSWKNYWLSLMKKSWPKVGAGKEEQVGCHVVDIETGCVYICPRSGNENTTIIGHEDERIFRECKMNCVKQEYSFIFVTHSNNERRSRFQHLQGTDP